MRSRPLAFQGIHQDNCSFDATTEIPPEGAVLIAAAHGQSDANGNWTAVRVTVTNLDTGGVRTGNRQNDSEDVELVMIVRESGRYRVQAVRSNFREACVETIVAGRTMPGGFFEEDGD